MTRTTCPIVLVFLFLFLFLFFLIVFLLQNLNFRILLGTVVDDDGDGDGDDDDDDGVDASTLFEPIRTRIINIGLLRRSCIAYFTSTTYISLLLHHGEFFIVLMFFRLVDFDGERKVVEQVISFPFYLFFIFILPPIFTVV